MKRSAKAIKEDQAQEVTVGESTDETRPKGKKRALKFADDVITN